MTAFANQQSPSPRKKIVEEQYIEFEFQITGMSCVNCSNNIERKMRGAYEEKEMQSINIILLVHKMLTRFPQHIFDDRIVTPQQICEFVQSIGFGCSLLGMSQIAKEGRRTARNHDENEPDRSNDSLRIRGLCESSSEKEKSIIDPKTGTPIYTPRSAKKSNAVIIKASNIEINEKERKLSNEDVDTITKELFTLDGIVDC